ncbi:Efm4p NDAI_0A02460 [Naumovozyma dairenensis CBS 421]|uniref:Protein-lysine N-methyltransferase EFM4 n=1 Tax=Naumovozyma dairenensis (strain ATCC 10597 / BCRC 20456 / CBS 421 / NBRC 0211 / NRRL Y-12639) TaxID=1071378 RepID=G0W3L6_NAUDC|nr:hypothetical protein NDAI_0A02460 [Naumovozyma dairenensis CBS 421]CCD22404.1 hypothetical protein NDAI_0A02460 [Naumovozyma dairenensis CBS 421]
MSRSLDTEKIRDDFEAKNHTTELQGSYSGRSLSSYSNTTLRNYIKVHKEMEDTTKLNTSKLGTKEYWDNFYNLERKNFEENSEDTGECWFDDSDAERKMVAFLTEHIGEYKIQNDASMLDLGTGNGHLLFELYENEFNGPMLGVDYSEQSVAFAREIAKSKDIESTIKFSQADIFENGWNPGKFDIVLDKGTLDAIALSGIKLEDDKTVVDVYGSIVENLLEKDSIFLITSCNFTQEELIKTVETDKLKCWETIKYPVFQFGGVKGSSICSVAFVKQ